MRAEEYFTSTAGNRVQCDVYVPRDTSPRGDTINTDSHFVPFESSNAPLSIQRRDDCKHEVNQYDN